MSSRGGKALTIVVVSALAWYTGIKFWQPIVIEQLKKDGNLREDVYVPEFEDQPKSWLELRDKVKEALHPEVDFDKNVETMKMEALKAKTQEETKPGST